MGIKDTPSVQVGLRVPNTKDAPYHNHLAEKARANAANKHNHVATEINELIRADFEKAQALKGKSKK